jgi:2',3'-cyclic-nucleotide 2'-phosphodiesterase (5'-nucleotidase family)
VVGQRRRLEGLAAVVAARAPAVPLVGARIAKNEGAARATAVVDQILKGSTPVGPTDTVRFVANDVMYTGGDGYTAFSAGTDGRFKGDLLLDVAIDYVTAHSPVAPVKEGRVVGR